MKPMRFTWDPEKARLNQKKHGVSFEEARSIFYDDNARIEHDPDHSEEEDRFILLIRGIPVMRKEYNFSSSKKNPYSRRLKQQITIRIETETVDYFKQLAQESGISYQNLINMYLRECVATRKKPAVQWS